MKAYLKFRSHVVSSLCHLQYVCLLPQGYLQETIEEEQAAGPPEEEATAIVGHQDRPPLERCAASKLASATLWLADDTCVLSEGGCASKGEKNYSCAYHVICSFFVRAHLERLLQSLVGT